MKNSSTNDPNNPEHIDLVSDKVRQTLLLVNYAIICEIISFVGIVANIINIAVFTKQGFKDSINISLMSLAISDLACSFSMFCTNIFHNPLLQRSDQPFSPLEVMYVTVGYPHVCFLRITGVITAFITLERCLCIAMPLKVKTIITPFRTKVINASIFGSMITLFSPFYFVNRLDWVYNMSRNRTILSLTFTQNREIVDSATFFIHSVFLTSVLLVSVAISTIILVVKLHQKTQWREAVVAQTASKPETIFLKDKKVVRMITLISAIFVVCYFPSTVLFLVMVCYPEFSIAGHFQNTFFVAWSVAFIPEAVNSSVNICVYYKMSSKFYATLCKLFC